MTTHPVFPEILLADMPDVPPGFEDVSWRTDACPCYARVRGGRGILNVWVDYPNAEERESGCEKRFSLVAGPSAFADESSVIIDTDDWEEILMAIFAFDQEA